ncbi:MAG: hypothetical protein Q3977_03370 [Oscillospiraceae bacterium]|nr:hypothetical protein [Oscillospiraceae bacterium]
MKKHVAAALLLCILAVCLLPTHGLAADLFFVAVNDSIPLTLTDAAPYSEGSTLYVPGAVFGANGLGIAPSHSETSETFTLFSRQQRLVFDLKNGGSSTEDGISSTTSAVVRGGTVYLPVAYCARHFGRSVSLLISADGYRILRFTNGQQIYSNALFLEKAENFITQKAQQYQPAEPDKPSSPQKPPEQQTGTPDEPEQQDETRTPSRVYLAVVGAETMQMSLAELRSQSVPAVFFLTAREIAENTELVCRIRAAGYPVGLTAEGEGDVSAELAAGNGALADLFAAKTLLALLDTGQSADGYFAFSRSRAVSAEQAAERSGQSCLIVCRNGVSRALNALRDVPVRYRYLRETTRI